MAHQLSNDQKALLAEVLESQGYDIIQRIIEQVITFAQLRANQHVRDGQFHEATQQQAKADALGALHDQLRKAII